MAQLAPLHAYAPISQPRGVPAAPVPCVGRGRHEKTDAREAHLLMADAVWDARDSTSMRAPSAEYTRMRRGPTAMASRARARRCGGAEALDATLSALLSRQRRRSDGADGRRAGAEAQLHAGPRCSDPQSGVAERSARRGKKALKVAEGQRQQSGSAAHPHNRGREIASGRSAKLRAARQALRAARRRRGAAAAARHRRRLQEHATRRGSAPASIARSSAWPSSAALQAALRHGLLSGARRESELQQAVQRAAKHAGPRSRRSRDALPAEQRTVLLASRRRFEEQAVQPPQARCAALIQRR